MDVQFIDRILTCSDCQSDFIFTAGEQLFFLDKQFKNDPKRCKPCKSRRAGLASASTGGPLAAAGLSRIETRTDCSACGIETTVPFKPTQGRPVLCRQCFQGKLRSGALVPLAAKPLEDTLTTRLAQGPAPELTQAQTASALTDASLGSDGVMLSPDAAVLAAASMSAASPESSVASAVDLASISNQALESMRSTARPFAMSSSSQLAVAGLLTNGSTFPEA